MKAVQRWCIYSGAALLGLAWLMPGHYFPWLTFQSEFVAGVGAGLVGTGAWLGRNGRARWPALALIALAAACIPLFQLAWGEIRFVSDGVLAATYVAGFGLSVAAGATLASEDRIDIAGIVLGALCVAAIAVTGMELMQWQKVGIGAFVDGAAPLGRYYGNFAQPNNAATALGMGVCALLLAYVKGKIGPVGCSVGLAFLGFGLVMTQSRTGWVFVAMLGLWLLLMRRRANLPLRPMGVLTGAGVFAAAVVSWSALNSALSMAHHASVGERVGVANLRLIHWQTMWDAAWRQPWLGYGWTQAVLGQEAVILDHPATGEVLTNSHNWMLDLVIWNGIPLGLLLISALALWFGRQLWICRQADRALVLAATGAIFLHAMVEFPLDYAFLLLPAGLLMGAVDGQEPYARAATTRRGVLGVPTCLACALLVWIGTEYVEVEDKARAMRFVAMGIGLDRVTTAPEPDVVLLDRPKNLHRYMLTRAQVSSDPGYLAWVRDVASRHPMAPAMLRHAMAAALNGRPDEARATLAKLCRMHPPERCDEGRVAWQGLQQQYPALKPVAYPPTPPELQTRQVQPAGGPS